MKAPERIWINSPQDLPCNSVDSNSIEYVRADVFIEKACTYLNEKCRKFILTAKDIEDFKTYMKGE
jgi:hypothetical protein